MYLYNNETIVIYFFYWLIENGVFSILYFCQKIVYINIFYSIFYKLSNIPIIYNNIYIIEIQMNV